MQGSARLSVPGFRFGGTRGKKYGVAIVTSNSRCTCSLMVTSNKIRAAPVELSLAHAQDRSARAVVITSGNANAFTGQKGREDALRIASQGSEILGIRRIEDVIVNSTGIIGQNLFMPEIEELIKKIAHDLKEDDSGVEEAADAMRTTDAFKKIASRTVAVEGKDVKITGIIKGAGMVAPKLGHATMIAVIATNAFIPSSKVDLVLTRAVEESFNMTVVDGDTSTNDMVVLLANGQAGNEDVGYPFQAALDSVCRDLAKMLVKDGEGATKVLNMVVRGAASSEDARKAARAVVSSTLVKTALFGENPNWGRIIAAIGYSGAEFDKNKLSLSLKDSNQEVLLVKNGRGVALKGTEELKIAGEVMKSPELTFTAELGVGEMETTAYGCDLGYGYVKINAEYTT